MIALTPIQLLVVMGITALLVWLVRDAVDDRDGGE